MKSLMTLLAAATLFAGSPAVAGGGQRGVAPAPVRVDVFQAPG
ncbi:MAG TPA: hypothetical protein VK886_23720 [Vicinamibacterales bacterium]|nr:hypothetical protein [Vicinamibacterales bacterium]